MDSEEIKTREAKARELHRQGCNCCQSVVLAYADCLPVDAPTASQLSSPFGRGMMGLRQTCGCVTAMGMVCGLCGRTMFFKGLANQFREENGELSCPELLRLQGHDHSCEDLVGCAARLVGEIL